ncbi:aspartyl-tRNA(Asn)/glutamyl-tRNA(Gln) amidotransferase subunit A [Gemmobacter megaterium]|uniref:Aspartyl-tRNA(Asn)/glutamyl-tRNA(Gln) amidotransferase subunit A n=1 Tax=Gemmobacter megaterium TaxID=1086013 RepID=A0A1N7P0Y5_9RHOB|nr:amidase family protein [Gemmobacter megaterium]GGE15285.1 amidase [Gemmobacter megaterium]SIT04221.1 aspartyl-tRNA(Asn)/glutamyl-tRNA(Gln) amidotransferase subunit A [Gemmobacter megaterium]
MGTEWLAMSAGDLGRGIGDGSIHAVELAEAFLEALEQHPDTSRIYARTTPDRARAEAMAAHGRAKAGLRLGLLDGVPLSWKDLFDTAGVATEAGSALLQGRTPARDATVLERATRAGLVCLGKTHMSELAFSGLGLNPVTATPPNINDPRAVPGGSSSGAAASVAFGLAPAAIGSDTGGSVRIPSAWNDLVGLKTTHGRLPLTGAVPLCETFDTIGPLCRTVEDCALLLAVMEGGKAPDLAGASLVGARFAVLETVALDDLRPEPARGFDDALARLTRAGARIERIRFPALAEAMSLSPTLFTGEAWGIWRDTIERAPHKMFPQILDRFRGGAGVSAADYVAGWRRLNALRVEWAAATAGYDAILTPTAPIMPPDAARLLADADYYVTENLLTLRNTRIGNLMNCCALSLPTSEPSCGLQLLAPPMAEPRLLRLGMAAEAALR